MTHADRFNTTTALSSEVLLLQPKSKTECDSDFHIFPIYLRRL